MMANVNVHSARPFPPTHNHHSSLSGLPGVNGFEYKGMSTSHNTTAHGLPKLETSGFSADFSGGLRTAPVYGGFNTDLHMNYGFAYNTINPNAIHLNNLHGLGIETPMSAFPNGFITSPISYGVHEDESSFDMMTQGFENQMIFAQPNESAIEMSSPSAMSTNSPSGISEAILDGHTASMAGQSTGHGTQWMQPMPMQNSMLMNPLPHDFVQNTFTDMLPAPRDTISPKSLLAQAQVDTGFPTPPMISSMDPPLVIPNYAQQSLNLSRARQGASTASTSSIDSSLRQSSTTTNSIDLVGDHTRAILISTLLQTPGANDQRKYSQPSISSPLSPPATHRTKSFNINNFPSTSELQRYVNAYIQHFHPHLPFLHIPSLNFESPEYSTAARNYSSYALYRQSSLAGGGGCLLLSIAAIGALYEFEMGVSKDLFENAKRLINHFLTERRKAQMTKPQFGMPHQQIDSEDPPLWLVQAMLLNIIYGYNCGDKTSADIANTHCATLISLARGADLARDYSGYAPSTGSNGNMLFQDQQMAGMSRDNWKGIMTESDDSDWQQWKTAEERKRTLYSVFILSSLLVSAYNHAPALTNSEIRLDLPCDEELWNADNAQGWRARGGLQLASARSIKFGAALGHLLTAAQREKRAASISMGRSNELPENEIQYSSFGCLILINALHNYIWETRQRHLGRQWTDLELEQMHNHIEPALRAWRASWMANPRHSTERPNPFGAGPLSADGMPLLQLAYVRLFFNQGSSKEAFWHRDYNAMAQELAKGSEVAPTNIASPPSNNGSPANSSSSNNYNSPNSSNSDAQSALKSSVTELSPLVKTSSIQQHAIRTQRERYLRRSAMHAAGSLSLPPLVDCSHRELPVQSFLCAFDSAQVLAEWVGTLQDRVGKYLGVLGSESNTKDFSEIPAVLLLEDEDRALFGQIREILQNIEANESVKNEGEGYGSRILLATSRWLDGSAVWPVVKLMARSLEIQAVHANDRALRAAAARA